MKLKETINADYVAAFKAKDTVAKSALIGLKAKILEAEKAGSAGNELSESDLLKILISTVKQRKQSIEAFTNAGRTDLAEQESAELAIVEKYMPKLMDEEDLKCAIAELISSMPEEPNKQKLMGMLMGNFNKKYPGRTDAKVLKEAIEKALY